jgi:hypothetical protein
MKRSQSPQEPGAHRQKLPFDVTSVKGSATSRGSVRRGINERLVPPIRLGRGTQVNVRDVHDPPANAPHLKRRASAGGKPRNRETRDVNDDSSFRLNAPENAVRNHKVPIILEHGMPTVLVDIEGMSRTLIVDTDSNIWIVQPGIS